MNFQPRIDFIWQTNLFVENFFSVALFFKITRLRDNSLNKRSTIEAEISLVSSTENHFFIRPGCGQLAGSKQDRRLIRLSKGPILPLDIFYQLFKSEQNNSFCNKKDTLCGSGQIFGPYQTLKASQMWSKKNNLVKLKTSRLNHVFCVVSI